MQECSPFSVLLQCERLGVSDSERKMEDVFEGAMTQFKLLHRPSTRTISCILKAEAYIDVEVDGLLCDCKRNSGLSDIQLDNAMSLWLLDTRRLSVILSANTIKSRAFSVQIAMKICVDKNLT